MLFRLFIAYAAVALVSVFAPNAFLFIGITTFVLMFLSLRLVIYFSDRVIGSPVREYLVASAGLVAFWIILRGAKYVAFEETGIVARHIWYAYYVPALMIPHLSLCAALSVGRPESGVPGRVAIATLPVSLTLIGLVLTNDLHRLVFRFNPGFAGWDYDYTRGPVFTAIYVWILIEFTAVMVILFRRCRLSSSRRLIWVPVIPALFGITYMVLYALGLWPRIGGSLFGELPEAVAFSVAGVWMGLIQIGLIPSNEGYGELFEASDLAAEIADSDFNVIYRSANAAVLGPDELRSEDTLMLDENTRLHRAVVRGGYVYWQDDVAELNQVNRELSEVGERLAEESELIRLENELAEERAQLEARTRVYDLISEEVSEEARKIAALSSEAEARPELFGSCMGRVLILGTYIKRYANLSLIAADRDVLDARELHLAVSELLARVADYGVPVLVAPPEGGAIPSLAAKRVFRRLEELIEAALPSLTGVTARVTGSGLRITLEGAELPGFEAEDGTTYARLSLEEEAMK